MSQAPTTHVSVGVRRETRRKLEAIRSSRRWSVAVAIDALCDAHMTEAARIADPQIIERLKLECGRRGLTSIDEVARALLLERFDRLDEADDDLGAAAEVATPSTRAAGALTSGGA